MFFSKTELSGDLHSVPQRKSERKPVTHWSLAQESQNDLKGKPVQFEVSLGKEQPGRASPFCSLHRNSCLIVCAVGMLVLFREAIGISLLEYIPVKSCEPLS